MYNKKDIQFAGKHDFDSQSAIMASQFIPMQSQSIGIFQWVLKNSGKELKRGKVVVRVVFSPFRVKQAIHEAEGIVRLLDAGMYKGKKTVNIMRKK